MSDFSLVPVDHQPDFGDVSLVPVDHDPFSSDRTTQQVQIQQAQAQPESPAQQAPMGADQPNVGAQFSDGNKTADIARGAIIGEPQPTSLVPPSYDDNRQIGAQLPEFADGPSAYSYASLAPSLPYWPKSSKTGSNQQQFSMASHAAYSKCVDKCLHLLASPSGDLQSSEFRRCVAQCMGRL